MQAACGELAADLGAEQDIKGHEDYDNEGDLELGDGEDEGGQRSDESEEDGGRRLQ